MFSIPFTSNPYDNSKSYSPFPSLHLFCICHQIERCTLLKEQFSDQSLDPYLSSGAKPVFNVINWGLPSGLSSRTMRCRNCGKDSTPKSFIIYKRDIIGLSIDTFP
ncbi:hypothetical protein NPIL_359181 [Nephila pilipes]|uniref:Uncharacterized protein n=1 Tax=Nephila pilipes TaxID=299642 RepID=A0A8X6PS37_NEPPI|nr:hypothetical protein NPIL_359181 [Nephila pilipes]